MTLAMIGGDDDGILKLKAGETSNMFPFAEWLLDTYGGDVEHCAQLREGYSTLAEYMDLMRTSPRVLSDVTIDRMMFLVQRHLHQLEHALISFLPKHHLWVHIVHRLCVA